MGLSEKRRRRAAILTVGAAVAATLVASPASASTPCEYNSITINSNPGAEPPSSALGHAHLTGSHYIAFTVGDIWHYWADNNGNGWANDKWDTFYAVKTCAS